MDEKFDENYKYDRYDSDARSVDSFTSSSSMKITYSVNSQSEYGFALRSVEKSGKPLSFVQQMKLKFENIESELQFKPPSRFIPELVARTDTDCGVAQLDVPSEEEVDDFGESELVDSTVNKFKVELQIPEISVDEAYDENSNEVTPDNGYHQDNATDRIYAGDSISTRHSEPLPEARNRHIIYKSHSCKQRQTTLPDPTKAKTNDKLQTHNRVPSACFDSHGVHIINELIATEQSYVDTLKRGIANYVSVFKDEANLRPSLRGKKYFLFGNIEQLVELHEHELLPMLQRNQNDVAKICEQFYNLLMDNRLYGYVLYAINKSNSEKICIEEKEFFKGIQDKAGDKLGVDSFLVQPIQRLPRYHLLFEQMISKFFKSDIVKYKTEVGLCCKVEKHIRNLLGTVNESMQINDIEDCNDINLLYQGCFKRCDDFSNFDHALRRTYKCRLFIFERSVVYTEIIKDKRLIFRGFYPRERIGIVVGKKNFSLFYQKRKVQECDFSADSQIQEQCVDLIMDMMKSFAVEEKEKIKEKYHKANYVYRRPGPRLALRHSSRFSNDSGVASVYSVGSNTSDETNPRTTWYAENLIT